METELKLEFASGDAEALAAAPILAAAGEAQHRHLRSIYYDTADHALRNAGVTLRVRRDGERHLQNVKAAGTTAGLFARPEWEQEVPGEAPVIGPAAGPLAALLGDRDVAECFVNDVQRSLWLLDHGGATIEVALDRGETRVGTSTHPIRELELELKAGPVAALFDLARLLDAVAPLRLGVQSKAERGFALVDGRAGRAIKAERLALDREDGVGNAFAAIAHACLRQFRLNEALLLAGSAEPRPLHQARVGLRRLRSALSLFRPLFRRDPQAALLGAGLRELASVLGEVRDLDVLIAAYTGPIRDRATEARVQAFARARARMEAPETRLLMLDLVEWLELGAWRTAPHDPALCHDAVGPFAAELLRKRRKRLKRQGERLADLSDEDRHQVRIEAKKLRYVVEFFAPLWARGKAGRRASRFLEAVERFQEELGGLNDAATARHLLASLDLAALAPPALPDGNALKRAESALETLMDVRLFWRSTRD